VAAKWIEGEVAKILDRENVSSIEPPLLPEELLIKDDSDELDEEAIIG
jgi:hypothetical protein